MTMADDEEDNEDNDTGMSELEPTPIVTEQKWKVLVGRYKMAVRQWRKDRTGNFFCLHVWEHVNHVDGEKEYTDYPKSLTAMIKYPYGTTFTHHGRDIEECEVHKCLKCGRIKIRR